MNWFLFGLIIVILIILIWLFYRKLRKKEYSNLMLFCGKLKSGKSALSIWFAISKFKQVHFIWRIRCIFEKLFKKPLDEEPYIYSNIPLFENNSRYKKYNKILEKDHLLRKKRFTYKSIVFIDECSLVADSQTIKDNEVNENLLLFVKLFAHETKGGYLILNTQSILDCHYSAKRCVTSYIFIEKCIKIPFFCLYCVRDMINGENGNNLNVNVVNGDEDKSVLSSSCKWYLVSKKVWKQYDRFAMSKLTDDLGYSCSNQNSLTLKYNQKHFATFKDDTPFRNHDAKK